MLPQKMLEEVEAIVGSYRHPRTGEPMSPTTKKRWLGALSLLYADILARHPDRTLSSLSDFVPQDFKDYRVSIEGRKDRVLKGSTISSRLMALKGLFKAAHAQQVTLENIVENFKAPRTASPEQYKRLQPDEIERLCAINEKRLERMNAKQRFLYLRDIAMVATQKDAALRASEVVRLSEDDVLWDRHTTGRHVPIIIRESKGRARGHEDTTYLSHWGARYIARYLKARNAYFEEARREAGIIKSAKSHQPVGPALFCTDKGAPMASPFFYEREIFPKLIARAGLNKSYTTHYMRHTRITEWVESGMDPKRVQRLARHRDVQMTLRYYHFNDKELLADLDKRFGVSKPKAEVACQTWPEKAIRLALFRYVLKETGQSVGDAALERLDSALQDGMKPEKPSHAYYTVHEACAKLRIKRTQLYAGWIRAGHIHPTKLKSRTVFLKAEVDGLASLRTTKEASRILGYKEKVPVTVTRLATRGIIPAIKRGRGWRFKDRDLVNFLLEKYQKNSRLAE